MKPTLIYFGTPDFSATVLEKIIQSGEYTVKAVVTNPDAPVGRQQIMTPSPVSQVAQSHHISTLKPVKIDPEFLREHSDTLQADLYIVFAFGQILPKELIEKPPHGTLNIHTSLLPKYRGTAPVQAAIYNQESQTGPTIMVMDEQMDHGPILAQEPFILDPKDTTETVTQKMAEAGAALLLKALPDYLENTIIPQAQDDTQATFTWKKAEMKEAGYFNIENPPSSEKLDAMIRAFYPWPNAWTKWNGKIVKFYPGGLVQMEGKNKVKLEEFLRGYPDFPIKYL
jgi:methionyl-tRNA formyltransferase